MARTLVEADLAVAEVTFRSKNAPQILREMKAQFPELLVGAGTVLNQAQVTLAKEANADFIVSPGLNVDTIKASQDAGIAIVPGINNPTAIELMPTGGINQNNVMDYLAINRVFCCGLSWMVDSKLIKAGDWNEIKSRIAHLKSL